MDAREAGKQLQRSDSEGAGVDDKDVLKNVSPQSESSKGPRAEAGSSGESEVGSGESEAGSGESKAGGGSESEADGGGELEAGSSGEKADRDDQGGDGGGGYAAQSLSDFQKASLAPSCANRSLQQPR